MWELGKIPEGILNEEYKSINYISEPFNDSAAVSEWTKIYGNIHGTGDMADYRHPQPQWAEKIADFLELEKVGISFYRMKPGIILPYHSDAYVKYINYHKINDNSKIYRAIVFLEDWKSGHIFEIDGNPIYNYSKGTYVLWQNNTPHMAANLGPSLRYTLQITGVK